MYKLVLIRHGESRWNQENRFTGWQDVDLSEKGRAEASAAGRTLKENGFVFDVAWTSVLKRAIRTCWTVQEELDLMWIPVHKHWRLNERHYGALTGLDKAETAARHGEEQVKIWRRSYDTPPPPMGLEDPRHPKHDAKYQGLTAGQLPSGESLKDTVARVLPAWEQEVAPAIRQGKRVLMVAHGNSLRALIQHLEKLTPAQIMEINVPTGVPLLYELKADLSVIGRRYLGDQAAVEASMTAVAKQGKAKA